MLSKWLSPAPAGVLLAGVTLTLSCSSPSGSGAPITNGSSGAPASAGHAGSGEASAGAGAAAAGSNTGTGSAGGANATAGSAGTSGADGTGGGSASGMGGGGASASGGNTGTSGALGAGASSVGASGGSSNMTGTVPASDTFDGTTLNASWSVFRPDLADIAVADGSLSIAPRSGSLWYQASQADLVYKLVTGDFKATTTVHARKASNRATTPTQFADVGGIMARNPSGSSENYILGVVGYAEMNQLAVEHKSTTSSKSVYGEVAFMPDAEFRMCRVGSTFTIYYRAPGDTSWGPAFAPFERSDLPATVQVGAIAYTGAASPDFVAIFDDFQFEPLGAGCTQ